MKVRSYGNENVAIESELLLDIGKNRADLVWVCIGVVYGCDDWHDELTRRSRGITTGITC